MTAKSAKSKRIIATLLAASLVLPILPMAELGGLTVTAVEAVQAALASENKASAGLEFTSNGDGTCYVSGIGTCTDTNLIVPSRSPDGDIVTSIGDGAFWGCTSFESITFSDSLTSIGSDAFSSLTTIAIPAGVTSIGKWAFLDCTNLESITVSKDNPVYHSAGNCLIETESKTLMRGCSNSFIPDDGSVTSIGWGAFNGSSSLESITIPDSVTEIGYAAFYNCTNLESIVIPDSVTSIGERAFWECTSLESITIPHGVPSIGERAFSDCTSLTSITIPDSVTEIDSTAFYGCTSLASLTILNPGCHIDSGKIPATTTIYGYAGSTAEAYAEEKGNPFVVLLRLPGDANGSGKVDMRDAVVIQQYLNDWNVEINESAADVNADNKIDMRDAVLIQQYLNGWNVELK